MKIWYSNDFFNLTSTQFNGFIFVLKASHNDYRGNTAAEYYIMLEISHLRDEFVKELLERLK